MAGLQFLPQRFEGPALQLFDGSLASSQFLRDFKQALLLDIPQFNHAPLRLRQARDQLKQHRAPLERGIRRGDIRRRIGQLPAQFFAAAHQGIGGDAQQPREKRYTAPFVTSEILQSPAKRFGRYIFGFSVIARLPDCIGPDPVKIPVVEIEKTRGIGLGSRDQIFLVLRFRGTQRCSVQSNR